MELIKPFLDMIRFQTKDALPQTLATFKALVNAIVPQTPELAEERGHLQLSGAADLHTAEYLIWSLNNQLSLSFLIKNFNIYLANATAEMLNIGARELINKGENKKPINSQQVTDGSTFAALDPVDGFCVVTNLEQLQIDLTSLPLPFYNNPGFVLAIIRVITLLSIKGYYTEWSGYGSTRMESPEKRLLEDFPLSWKQVGYPGPSLGYHSLRG